MIYLIIFVIVPVVFIYNIKLSAFILLACAPLAMAVEAMLEFIRRERLKR